MMMIANQSQKAYRAKNSVKKLWDKEKYQGCKVHRKNVKKCKRKRRVIKFMWAKRTDSVSLNNKTDWSFGILTVEQTTNISLQKLPVKTLQTGKLLIPIFACLLSM